MKKTILLLSVFALLFTACGSDDDAAVTNQDPLVGTWKYSMYLVNGVEVPLEACEELDTEVYNEDGTATVTYYEEDVDSNCVVVETLTGTWALVSAGVYSLSSDGFTDVAEVTFEGNTYYIEDTYDNGTPEDTSDDITYRDVYTKQ